MVLHWTVHVQKLFSCACTLYTTGVHTIDMYTYSVVYAYHMCMRCAIYTSLTHRVCKLCCWQIWNTRGVQQWSTRRIYCKWTKCSITTALLCEKIAKLFKGFSTIPQFFEKYRNGTLLFCKTFRHIIMPSWSITAILATDALCWVTQTGRVLSILPHHSPAPPTTRDIFLLSILFSPALYLMLSVFSCRICF